MSQYSSEYDRNRGMSLVQTEAISLVNEDWSEIGMLRNEQTGKFPYAGLAAGTRLTIWNTMMGASYSHGLIYSGDGTGVGITGNPGVIRVGPYPVTNFQTIMGF